MWYSSYLTIPEYNITIPLCIFTVVSSCFNSIIWIFVRTSFYFSKWKYTSQVGIWIPLYHGSAGPVDFICQHSTFQCRFGEFFLLWLHFVFWKSVKKNVSFPTFSVEYTYTSTVKDYTWYVCSDHAQFNSGFSGEKWMI